MNRIIYSPLCVVFVLCLLLQLAPGQQQGGAPSPADDAALRQLIGDLMATYTNRDAVKHMQLWSDKSPQYAAQKQTVEQTFKKLEKIEVKSMDVRTVAVDGDNATVIFISDMYPIDRTGRPLDGLLLHYTKVFCVKEAGQWKLMRSVNPSPEFADAITATKTRQEWKKVMADNPAFLPYDVVNNINGRGIRQFRLGEYPEAVRLFLIAKDIAEQTGEKLGEAQVLNNLGNIYNYQGNYALALETYKRALDLAKELKRDDGIAHLTTNLGLIYHNQGNAPLALQYYEESLKRWQDLNEPREIAECLINIGSVYRTNGDYALALDYLNRGLKIDEELKSRSDTGSAYAQIGEVYMAQGDYKSALDFATKAKDKFESIPDKAGLANALGDIGLIYNFQNDPAQALEFATKAEALAKEIGSREIQWNALVTMGNAYRAQGNDEKAQQSFDAAISVIEDIRTQVAGNEQDVQRFFENKVSPYHQMIDSRVARKDDASALWYAERAKGRVLLDILKSGRVNVTKSMTAAEVDQEKQFNGQLVALNAELEREMLRPQPDQKHLTDLTARLQKARLDHEDFTAKLYATHLDLKAQRGESQPIKFDDMSALLTDSQSAIMEYVVTTNKLFLFVVTRDQGGPPVLKSYTIPTEEKTLTDLVSNYRDKLAKRDLRFRADGGQLYGLLIKPAQAQLKGKNRLVIVPDGVLWELPFQALTDSGNHYLIETSAISYAPSISVLAEMEKVHRKRAEASSNSTTLIAFGNPAVSDLTSSRVKAIERDASLGELPDAEAEVKGIAEIYGAKQSKVYVKSDARKDLFEAEASKYRIVHLATHALLNNASPMYSQVVLAADGKQDGLLEAWEIMNLNLNADMVVMSACETARGRVGAGEGVIGLSWSLFVAGSPTTVVSQWKVDSAATSQLMQEFHRRLNSHNQTEKALSKSEAMREASLKLLRDRRYSNPFYWAGFVLMGDGN
ncbi:MAG TPA: CHAT domain-containing tetratricopeptide repeat protein [Blastocatellia bacterium]|nr:CHAT domain-containing tetratricopeptide repeat protein [Blastocatellia bacterium]